jgi:aspartate ammonia-lyase
MRIEKDSLGEMEIPDEALYGIHTLRSVKNFPLSSEFTHPYLIKAYLQVKLAAAETNYKCGILFKEKHNAIHSAIENLLEEADAAIERKSDSIYKKIIIDPYQGGAGNSLNMNINEVIANEGLKLMGRHAGDYSYLHPLDDVNLSQSANDTYPTALKIASIYLIRELSESFASLQSELQKKEVEFRDVLKLGRTQFQDAVPITLGQEFGAYAQAVGRDRWRLYNAEERLRTVNLGGTAIGNSVSATREYVANVNTILKKITKLPVSKSEDLIDSTQNLDIFVEIHGILKAGAVTIIKMCNDLRFLSSGPMGGIGEISLSPIQSGSDVMPGKVNPIILESSIQIAELIKGHDVIITNVAGNGNLELNAFIPLLAHTFLKSFTLLRDANYNLAKNCIEGIKANIERCNQNLVSSSAIAASLITMFGYDAISDLVHYAQENNMPFVKALLKSKLMNEQDLLLTLSKEMGVKIE